MASAEFNYTDQLPVRPQETAMRLVSREGIRVKGSGADAVLEIDASALETLAYEAFRDVSHFLRPAHLSQLRRILDDPEASPNDRYVALDQLSADTS